ncbi:Alkaline phosphatase H [Tolypocladium paradoxum]|uniref:alkaline phosphatase n=1 Tax=Tolypocladium paradoxum TaxID=94208 RepID=A0A2S4L5G6_9HYPO|nr:Alkaline phosphatase H [Tolypocladium paradoxum]
MLAKLNVAALVAASLSAVSAQTYQRLGTCPTLGCLLPPDQTDFLPGQLFDLRVEVHAPVNGSEAAYGGKPDEKFKVTIAKGNDKPQDFAKAFDIKEPALEKWQFQWFEDLFAEDKKTPSVVNVAAKAYRKLSLNEPGKYTVTLEYYNGSKTTAEWTVRPLAKERKAKNVILFIGDGMTTNMITAARLLGHKSINGKYQTLMKMDEFPVVGHQMTHSLDTYITDSANSASALYSGHKASVNAMGVYADSSANTFDDPKVETIVEIFRRIHRGAWGAVSTAYIADATPAALTGHTRRRADYGPLIDQALNGVTNYTWTKQDGPDVYFGGGAEQFFPGKGSYQGKDYYAEFAKKNYSISLNKTSLLKADPSKKALGIFCQSNLPVWLDRNVYPNNLKNFKNSPIGGTDPALDLPGLKDMTVKAVEILHKRGGDKGFFLMSEAASVDKQMHALDYDRALGDLLELDDTVRATIDKLKELKALEDTLIIVTADHGHGFDVWGSADTDYLSKQQDQRAKRKAIGLYDNSGLSQYTSKAKGIEYGTGANFPVNWEPRYAIAGGVGAMPDHREDYKVRKAGPRVAAAKVGDEYYVNPADAPLGFVVNGTLPTSEAQGVHSLTDVPVYALGPCQATFGGTYSNIDVFYKIANCLGLAREHENECKPKPTKSA